MAGLDEVQAAHYPNSPPISGARPGWNMTWPFARTQPPLASPIGQRWILTFTIFTCGLLHPLPLGGCSSHCPTQAPPHRLVRPAALQCLSVIPGTSDSVPGPLENVATSTSASSVGESMPGSTAPLLRSPASVSGPPLPLALGDGSEPAGSLVVHSVNSFSSRLVPVSVGRRFISRPLPDSKRTRVDVAVSVFSPLVSVDRVSPLVLSKFRAELVNHPDRPAVAYVLSGVQFGFHVGFAGPPGSLKSASSNMRSSFVHPSVIDHYLKTEVSLGRVAGPFPSPLLPNLHISRFGIIPKTNQPGKWRLILDLSVLAGHSVNDGIPKPSFSIQYVTVDAFIDGIMARGRSTLMAKFDSSSLPGRLPYAGPAGLFCLFGQPTLLHPALLWTGSSPQPWQIGGLLYVLDHTGDWTRFSHTPGTVVWEQGGSDHFAAGSVVL